MNRWLLLAGILGAIGVGLGAFGAHGLGGRVAAEQLASWQTAVLYHLLHAVALLGVGALAAQGHAVRLSGWLFALGIVLFSGSIYLLVTTGARWLGPVTPIGGLCLIAGWLALLLAARR